MMETRPTRKLWRINQSDELIICVSTSKIIDTGEYKKMATGLGQLRALPLVTDSLNNAYNNMKIKNILFSEETLKDDIKKDIILLGGPKTNSYTKKFLDEIKELSIVEQEESTIYWKVEGEEEKFEPIEVGDKVEKDYGLIIRMPNHFSSKTSDNIFCILSGGHTYGTIAAAEYFTQNIYEEIKIKENIGGKFIGVVSCKVIDESPCRLRLEKQWSN